MKKKVRSLLESGKKAIGVFIMYPFDTGLEVLKLAGVDFAIFDLEHEQLTLSEILPMIRTSDACGITSMVRVPSVDNESTIKKALDIGASGIVFPGISNSDQARKAVSYCKYAPDGTRGFCPSVRANSYGTFIDNRNYKKVSEEIVVTIIIESFEGVKNMEEIVAVDGIDVVTLGVFDLSSALGIPGQVNDPRIMQAVNDCIKLCEKSGKRLLVGVSKPEDINFFKGNENVALIVIASPTDILYRSYKSFCDGVRSYIQ